MPYPQPTAEGALGFGMEVGAGRRAAELGVGRGAGTCRKGLRLRVGVWCGEQVRVAWRSWAGEQEEETRLLQNFPGCKG